MNYFRSKAEHVADHLREAMDRGELLPPLPSLRNWSSQLEVSSGTLQAALQILKREGRIGSRPKKGYFLIHKPNRRPQHPPVVRWIWNDPKHRVIPPSPDLLVAVSQRLTAHDINFQLEWHNDSRIAALHKAGPLPHEMLVFPNLSHEQQKAFQGFQNALMIGLPLPGIRMPYISSDIFPAIRHATYLLLRHGVERVDLANAIGRRIQESRNRLEAEFQNILAKAPRHIPGEVVWIPDHFAEQCLTIKNLAKRIRTRHGIIVVSPLSSALFVMVLTNYGLKIPEQVEIVSMNCMPAQMSVFPPLVHYPMPLDQHSKTVCKTAIHYFESGAMPMLQKTLSLSAVSG